MTITHEHATSSMASERYLLGEMDDAERDDFEEHYFSCAICADEVRAGARLATGVRAHFAAGDEMSVQPRAAAAAMPAWIPARVGAGGTRRPRGIRRLARAAWPGWAATAALLLVVGYQNLLAHRPDAAPVAVSLSPLRPATRGAEPAPLALGTGVLPLLLELNVGPGIDRLSYRIRNENGGEVVAGEVASPASNAGVLILVPSGRLNPGSRYVISMSNAIDAASLIGEYRFSVARSP